MNFWVGSGTFSVCGTPGKAYYLGGKTGLPLGGTMSTEFTASCLQDGASCGDSSIKSSQTPHRLSDAFALLVRL